MTSKQKQQNESMKALDADAQEVVKQIIASGAPPIPQLTPFSVRMLPDVAAAARAVLGHHVLPRTTTPFPAPVGAVDHWTIEEKGREILLRIYRPEGDGPFPVLVYFHGGGFVIFKLDTYDSTCRALLNAAECIVVSVAYHQAPEHPFPAAAEDAFAAYLWVVNNATRLNANPERVAVAGESAGVILPRWHVWWPVIEERRFRSIRWQTIHPILCKVGRSETAGQGADEVILGSLPGERSWRR